MKQKQFESGNETNHSHCWHIHRGPIWMVIPDGHVLQNCCQCGASRMIHIDHATEHCRAIQWADYSSYFAPMGRYVKWGGY